MIPSGLVAQYAFDEGSGTRSAEKYDLYGDATLHNGVTWTTGRRGKGEAAAGSAIELPTTAAPADPQAYVSFPNGRLLNDVQRATISAWINMTEQRNWSRLFDFSGTSTGDVHRFMYLAPHIGVEGAHLAIFPGDAAEEGVARSNGVLPIGVWKHLAVTVDGATYGVFVDGHQVSSAATRPASPADLGNLTQAFLGKSRFPDPYLKAKLDDFRIYDRVLTRTEIQDLAWPSLDYTHLRFDEAAGTAAVDSSDRDKDGTLEAGATFTTGRVGNALNLSNATVAAAQYLSLPPNVGHCDNLTIALWANLRTVGNFTRFIDVFAQRDNFYFFTPSWPTPAGRALKFNIFKGADEFIEATYPDGANLAEWHHYAVTLNGAVWRLYFDGVQLAEKSGMTFKTSDLPIEDGAHAWIGKSMFPDPYLNGTVDDVRVSCRAFTPDEIKMLAR